jgi:hypothetical protein
MGSLRAVRAASVAELSALPWLPDTVAEAVHAHLHAVPPRRDRSPVPAVPR